MNIPNNLMTCVSPYSGMENRRTTQRDGQKSAFDKYLDVDRQRQKMRELPPGRMLDSVYMQFMDDYRTWKDGQPEVILPDSQGWTEPWRSWVSSVRRENAVPSGSVTFR